MESHTNWGNIMRLDSKIIYLTNEDLAKLDTIIIETPIGRFGFRKTKSAEDLVLLSKMKPEILIPQ